MTKRSTHFRLLRTTLITLLTFFLVWWTYLFIIQDRMIFPIMHQGHRQPPTIPPQAQLLQRIIPDGIVQAWYFPPPSATDQAPGPLLVYLHGNGETIANLHLHTMRFQSLGLGVLLIEYRGYGNSNGHPGQAVIGDDAHWFVQQTLTQPHIDPKRIIYFGRSLGGAVAADLATRHQPTAMILESTFTSMSAMARGHLAPPFLIRHPFRTDRTLAQLDIPILLIHGQHDKLIPLHHARRLHALAKQSTLIVLDGDHDKYTPQAWQQYWCSIESFLQPYLY